MKKYLVTLDENSIEIEVDNLTENNIYNAVNEKFELFGTYTMKLKFVKSMNIHTLTLTKRGSATTLLIKEIVEETIKSSFDVEKFNADIDKLLNGDTEYVNIQSASKEDLEDALNKKDFNNFGKDYDNDNEIIYYYGHKDWDVNNNQEYKNRLNVTFNLNDLSIELSLEDGYSVLKNFKETKKEIEDKQDKISFIEKQIEKLIDEKNDLENDIEDLESELSSNLYY
jgi:hypothetical protein